MIWPRMADCVSLVSRGNKSGLVISVMLMNLDITGSSKFDPPSVSVNNAPVLLLHTVILANSTCPPPRNLSLILNKSKSKFLTTDVSFISDETFSLE